MKLAQIGRVALALNVAYAVPTQARSFGHDNTSGNYVSTILPKGTGGPTKIVILPDGKTTLAPEQLSTEQVYDLMGYRAGKNLPSATYTDTRFVVLPDGTLGEVPANMSDTQAAKAYGLNRRSKAPESSKSALTSLIIAAQLLAGLPFAFWVLLHRRTGFANNARKYGLYGFVGPAWQCTAQIVTAYLLPLTADKSFNSAVGFGGWAALLGLAGYALGKWQDRKAPSFEVSSSGPSISPRHVDFSTGKAAPIHSTNLAKVALIVGLVIALAVATTIYYSPYQQCVRSKLAQAEDSADWDGLPSTAVDEERHRQSAKLWCYLR